MSVLSTLKNKVYGREWSFPYNCYEVGHGWTPYCTSAACDVGFAAFKNCVPLYSSLYLFTQLAVQRKYDADAFLETFKSVITSASFLSFNLWSGMSISCFLRNNSDRYYYRIQCYLPALIGSYIALLIERPARRPALAFYMANMSSEIVYKWAESRGYIRSLPHGEVLLFATGMACWLRFVRMHGFGHDPVSTALKYLIGPLEAKSRARSKAIKHDEDESPLLSQRQQLNQQQSNTLRISYLTKMGEGVTNFLNLFFDCHPVCPHKGRSLLNVAGRYRLLLKDPKAAFLEGFTAKSSINFGLFLGTFTGASKAVHCLLRRITGKQEVWHSAAAGGISGLSMIFSPKATLSTYIIWKCLEQYFFLAVKKGQITCANEVIGATYAISVNILLYIFALEPKFIRPSYMKFIDQLSDHRLHQVNRMDDLFLTLIISLVLDVFGTGASEGYEDWFPDLDPKHMSREFKELIFNWLIQPF